METGKRVPARAPRRASVVVLDHHGSSRSCSSAAPARIAELEDDVQNLRRAVLSSHEDSLMLAEGWRMAKDLDDFDIGDSLDVIITDLRDRMGQMQEFVT